MSGIIMQIALIVIFGLAIGSFLNALVWRMHSKESMLERSACPKCKKNIAWYDNIPVLSFTLLKGRCRNCGKGISWQYPLVEIIVAGLFFYAFIRISSDLGVYEVLNLFRDFFLISVMIVVFIYDLRWYLILDKITIPSIIVIFFLNLFLGF